jgi:hypothetical protein
MESNGARGHEVGEKPWAHRSSYSFTSSAAGAPTCALAASAAAPGAVDGAVGEQRGLCEGRKT